MIEHTTQRAVGVPRGGSQRVRAVDVGLFENLVVESTHGRTLHGRHVRVVEGWQSGLEVGGGVGLELGLSEQQLARVRLRTEATLDPAASQASGLVRAHMHIMRANWKFETARMCTIGGGRTLVRPNFTASSSKLMPDASLAARQRCTLSAVFSASHVVYANTFAWRWAVRWERIG